MKANTNLPHSTTSVYEGLKSQIVTGVYPPMAPLIETDIASLYNVSRNTVKKALLMLENEQLITMVPNKGATVRSYSLQEILDLLEVRATLEKQAIELTVPLLSQEKKTEMKDVFLKMEEKINSQSLLEYSAYNQQFHQIIYDACPNQSLAQMIENIKTQLNKYNTKTVLIPGRSKNSIEEHRGLLQAIDQGNATEAGELVSLHVMNIRKIFEDNHALLL